MDRPWTRHCDWVVTLIHGKWNQRVLEATSRPSHVKPTAGGESAHAPEMVEEECGIEHPKGRLDPCRQVGLQVPDGREPNAPDIATPNPSHHLRDTLEPFAGEVRKKQKIQGRSNLDPGARGGVKQEGDAVGLQEQKI